jgi:hypothetical protein
MTTTINRRTAFAGAAALSLVPAIAAAKSGETAIGKLWSEAEALSAKLSAYSAEIAESAANGGISGWMRLAGEANTLGGERYGKLMAILHTAPESDADLAVMAKVVLDDEIVNGAKGYAADRFAQATIARFGAVA